ncbi:MAG TPA: hypothetical protein DHW61_05105, partial [Lachnoclostridium phytofermentans]|nr:hypothetical protein [Lachnoclostridium phytofermentans]
MNNFVQTYLYFIKITIRKKMMYRASYIAGIIGQWLGYGTIFATLYIVVKKFKLLGGWDANEIAFLYSLSLISYAIGASVFYTPCTGLANKIRTGEFDQVLTRPINPLIHEILHGFNTGYLGHFILALLIMTSSLVKKNIILSNINILFIIVSIIGGALIQSAILILSSIGSFFMIDRK